MADLEYLLLDPASAYIDRFTAETATVALGWSRPGVTQVTLPDDHRVIGKLVDGCRLQVRYRDHRITEGQIWAQGGEGQATVDDLTGKVRSLGTVTLSMLDDADLVNAIEGWPKPSAAYDAQTDAKKRYTGQVDEILKAVVADNANTRLGLGWGITPATGLGATLTVDFRFEQIGDKLLDQLEHDMLGLLITRSGGTFHLDVQLGDEFSRPITLDSGVIGRWKWSKARPGATRMLDGGPSTGTARTFAQAIDSGLEDAWGIREGFTDQSSADTTTILNAWAARDLALAGPSAGLEVELNETDWFRFDPTGATGYQLGNRLQVQLPGASFNAPISTITLTDSPSDGLLVKPTVGEFYSSRRRMYKSVQRLVRGIRTLERR